MATLVLGALGTLVGGPLGGAIGALAGRQIDSLVLKAPGRDGPRLKDLALSTSSYGSAIPLVFGKARVGGVIIWATDLVESRSSSGGGKGKPKVTSYSYSSSFAVAVSGRPIRRIGRIWADGQLIRGKAGDLKTGGTMRVHTGTADQLADPLLAAGQPDGLSPAYRGCAYVVFEDLQLADYGNRIPALSFEVIADERAIDLADFVQGVDGLGGVTGPLPGLEGFELTGGSLRDVFGLLDMFYPLCADVSGSGLVISARPDASQAVPVPAGLLLAGGEDDFGRQSGRMLQRDGSGQGGPGAIRYYDPARDYQPGVQRGEGGLPSGDAIVEFPGVLTAQSARGLLQSARLRRSSESAGLRVRIGTIDPAIAPGRQVILPGTAGTWLVADWEWSEAGIELSLERSRSTEASETSADPGQFLAPQDLSDSASALLAFELPLDSLAAPDSPRRFLAVSASGEGWRGAQLLADTGAGFVTVGASGRERAKIGRTLSLVPGSSALVLEHQASVDIVLLGEDLLLEAATPEALSHGANRMMIGDEIMQYLVPVPLGGGVWRLHGLLRGRAGTEAAAQRGHPAETTVIALDNAVIPLDQLSPAAGTAELFAAIGLVDTEPAVTAMANRGASLRPLHPVHPKARILPDGTLRLSWARRARGAWQWADGVDTPLVEQAERYRIGAGPVDRPVREWESAASVFDLPPGALQQLPPGSPLWVQQIGSHALSLPAMLHILP